MLKLLSNFSIVLALSACQSAPKFPVTDFYEYDPDLNTCGLYKLVDFDRIQFDHVKDMALADCPALFGFTSMDTPKVLEWAAKMIEYSKRKDAE